MMLARRQMLAGGLAAALGPMLTPGLAYAAGVPGIVNVRDHGVKGDGVTIDSPAINAAIAYAAARGGGTVWFPPGTYASYSIRLESHITLHLDSGAVLLAASTPVEGMAQGGYDRSDDLPPAYAAFQDHGHGHWRNALIWGEGLENIAIEGGGLIWGRGLGRGHDYDRDRPISGRPGVGDKSIALKLCRNVRLSDFRVLEGGWFALLATGVDNLTIENLLIDTNRDGLDIDCCRNVHIRGCTINSPWDDAICPKSSYALGYPRTTENVTIAGCTVSGSYRVGSLLDGSFRPFPPAPKSTHGRIKLGTESNGGFRNIAITNCVFDHCRGLALETVDGAVLEDVTVSNIAMRGVTTAPIFLRLGARLRGPAGTVPGSLKRILIDGITSSAAAPMPSIIAGIAGHPVEDVKIANVFLQQVGGGDAAMAAIDPPANEAGYPEPDMFGPLPACGLFVRHARNIEVSHVEVQTIAADARPAFWLQDVDGFDATGLRLPRGRAFASSRVRDFRETGRRRP
ncbi:MAG TPA: glycoside hydrolase family 28 protein [Sphingomonas sp.]|jgi:polygalacturonase|nr:glycoside hydrolase family 28 protein [Sphingomonas sp.]